MNKPISQLGKRILLSISSQSGMRSGPNQDMAVCGLANNLNNPKETTMQTIAKIRGTLRDDKRFEKSGTTINIAVMQNNKLIAGWLGDSPLIGITHANKGSSSAQLTDDHSLNDPKVREYFPQATESISGFRLKGVNVACAGHGGLFDKLPTSSQIFEMNTSRDIASLIGIGSTIDKIVFGVVCDGIFDTTSSKQGGNSALSTKFKVSHENNLHFKKNPLSTDHCLEKIITLQKITDPHNLAEELVVSAQFLANSSDNTSAVMLAGSPDDLAEEFQEDGDSLVMAMFDGNGKEGHHASMLAAQILCENFKLRPALGLPLSQPHDLAVSPKLSPQTSSSRELTEKSREKS